MLKYLLLVSFFLGASNAQACCAWFRKKDAPVAPAAYAVSPGSLSRDTVTTGATFDGQIDSPMSAPVPSPYGQNFDHWERREAVLKREYARIQAQEPRNKREAEQKDDALKAILGQLAVLPAMRDADLGRIVADYQVVPGRTRVPGGARRK